MAGVASEKHPADCQRITSCLFLAFVIFLSVSPSFGTFTCVSSWFFPSCVNSRVSPPSLWVVCDSPSRFSLSKLLPCSKTRWVAVSDGVSVPAVVRWDHMTGWFMTRRRSRSVALTTPPVVGGDYFTLKRTRYRLETERKPSQGLGVAERGQRKPDRKCRDTGVCVDVTSRILISGIKTQTLAPIPSKVSGVR